MKPSLTLTLVVTAVLSWIPGEASAEESLRPLDTRTRCIVVFRECLVLIDKQDVDGIFKVVADGGGSEFKLYPDLKSLSPDLKRELQDVDTFFAKNFKNSRSIHRTFNKILFSDLVTSKKTVQVKSTASDEGSEATLHSIRVKIPDMDRPDFTELRFVEVAGEIYWVPFGW